MDSGIEENWRRTALPASQNSRKIVKFMQRHAAFLGWVVLPTSLAVLYFGLVASPQYVSEAQFVVRGQNNQSSPGLSSLMMMAGGGSGQSEDTYAVQDYVTSRDAAKLLLETQNLAKVYDTPRADFLARFPNFYSGSTFEHFYWYYQRHVIAELDTTSGLSSLQVRTFDANDSQRVAHALLVAAEKLVNKMNERQRRNLIDSSLRERDAIVARLRDLSRQIDDYRNKVAMLNPMRQSEPVLKDIASLQSMLMTTRLQVAQLQATAPSSPLIPVYQRRITALIDEIATASTGVTGDGKSLVPKISGYDDLILQRKLAEKELVTTTAALDNARAQADRQQLYLDEVTEPNLPDYPTYPRSLADIAVVFATMLGLYLMAKLIISGAREHQIH
ncbi:capsule polysaccharide export inner-membrane protein CtrB [Kozakia baliensis]|nr:capsule polysaccharide export inner-membrane protein CtrB [Kozakia baliensis]